MPDISGGLGTGSVGTPAPERAVPLSGQFRRGRFSALTGLSGSCSVGYLSYIESGSLDWLLVDYADRIIDWANAGVWYNGVKGIPAYGVGVTMQTTNPSGDYYLVADSTGSVASNRAAINAAIAACSVGYAVLIPSGKFYIDATIAPGKAIVLRGAGAWATELVKTTAGSSSSSGIISIAGSSSLGTATAITSGYSKGSSSVVVSSTSGLAVGQIVLIRQSNDPAIPVTPVGTGGTCTWCGADDSTRCMGEYKMIDGITGNTVTLNHPLAYDYQAAYNPTLARQSAATVLKNAGVENLSVSYNTSDLAGSGIYFANCAYCWVSGCHSHNFRGFGIYCRWGTYGLEVRKNYVHGATSWSSGAGYGVRLLGMLSDSLIEDNIVRDCHGNLDIDSGGAGNVFGYNYADYSHFDPAGSNSDYMIGDIGTHGAHPYGCLYEGNIVGQANFDNYWGSSSHHFLFRNHCKGIDDEGVFTRNLIALIADVNQHYFSVVGNVLGYSGYPGKYEGEPLLGTSDDCLYLLGHPCCSTTGYATDADVVGTMLRHGNYDYVNNATVWDPAISGRAIPNSMYLASKPSWFGDVAWPPIGPDVSGQVNSNPAKARYEAYVVSGNLQDIFD